MLENAQPKPVRGEHVLDREAQRLELRKAEAIAKTKAKVRDSFTCRWPIKHQCRGILEAAHIVDASLGGPMSTSNLISLCAFLHRRGPMSVHGKQIRIEAETALGADGPCSFWRRDDCDGWICVGVEVRPGVLRKV